MNPQLLTIGRLLILSITICFLDSQSFESDFFEFNNDEFSMPILDNTETFESPNTIDTLPPKLLFTASPAEITQAITSINIILNHLASFIAKVNSLPEIDKQITVWLSSGEIPKDSIKNWNDLYTQIQLLQTSLTRLQTQDAFTKEYRYIGYLVMDKKALDALSTLQKKLALESTFIPDSYFGLVKLSPESKNALKEIVSTLITAISQDNIVTLFNTVMQQFDPQAQKLIAEEKKAATQAGIRKKVQQTSLQTIGSQGSSLFGSLPYNDFADYSTFNFPSSSSSSYWPATTTPTPSTPPAEQKKPATPSEPKGSPSATPDKKGTDEKESEERKLKKYMSGIPATKKNIKDTSSKDIKRDTPIKKGRPTNTLSSKNIKSAPLETLVADFNGALNLAYELMSSENEDIKVINPLSENLNSTMLLPDKGIRYTFITQNLPQFYTLCQNLITILPQLTKKLATVSKKINDTIIQHITTDWISKNTNQETKESAGFVKWLQNYMQLIKKVNDTATPIGHEQKEAYFWNPTPPDSSWKEPVIEMPSDMQDSKELKTLFDQELERIEQTGITIDDADKQLYQEVKDQITDENIQAWLEQKKLLIYGKPSSEYETLPSYLQIALQQARENTSLKLIKELRRVSLFDIANILMKTKTAIERFTGKPITLTPPTTNAPIQPRKISV